MKRLSIPWQSWYGNQRFNLSFPDNWDVIEAGIKDAPNLTDEAIREAFTQPIGTPPLALLARGRKSVAIAIDDLTRPTETYRLLPIILQDLRSSGIAKDDILIIVSLGAHRPLNREDLIKKVGADIVENYRIYNHCCFDNLLSLGETGRGNPITANRFYMEAELKIGVSFIVPHYLAGFSGGGKIILPGICGIETIEKNHRHFVSGTGGGVGVMDGNAIRLEIDEAARRLGLAFSINVVGTSSGQTAGVYVGDLVEAHRRAVQRAKEVYATEVPDNIDVGIFNAFPKDTDFIQCDQALNLWTDPKRDLVKKGGSVVITTAASEGRGCHFLYDVGMRLFNKEDTIFPGREFIIFCPNISTWEVYDFYPKSTKHFKKWTPLVKHLQKKHGPRTRAAVFPCGPLQLES